MIQALMGNYVCDPISSVDNANIPKINLLLKKIVFPQNATSFLNELIPAEKGYKNENVRDAFSESVNFQFKIQIWHFKNTSQPNIFFHIG